VIQGSADMLCKRDLPQQKRVRFARAIVQAAENAASLTSQLLAFARRQPLKPELLEINGTLREIAEIIDRTMGERIQVSLDLGSDGCAVEVDKAQLQSAILNIASNARDAMPDGGTLAIRTRDIGSADGRSIALEFADSGQGMDEATLDRVFEPFFTTKGTGKGTGLGLSQVYGFASQSGGEVRVQSVPGKGTTIVLRLPCSGAENVVESSAVEASIARPQSPLRVLVVEDNEAVAAFAENLLLELGHKVTRASSGEEALDFTRCDDFDVVFSDIVMPGMGGLKLADTLAKEKPNLPVVLATGYSQELAEASSIGRPVVLKPYRIGTLTDAITGAVKRA